MSSKWDNDEEVQRFREYLQIPSVHPDINYSDCVKFVKKQADLLDLPVRVYELAPKKPVVVITWKGLQPELPSIFLNSHMDVVPVYEEHWTYPPFEARISEDGFIYARGTQDMKGIGMMHLEAVRRLKNAGVKLKRTVHISFVPDEETGGEQGMKLFAASEQFKALNIGFALDESCPSPDPNLIIAFNGERVIWQIKITCRGKCGHGSLLESGTAGEKLYYMIDKFMKFREAEKRKLDEGKLFLGEVTTVNWTKAEGGVQENVLPESLSASFDIRISPSVNQKEFENTIQTWCTEAGEGVTCDFVLKNPEVQSTRVDSSNYFWTALTKTVEEMGFQIQQTICPGATDARFVRLQGIPAISFSPLANTPILLHAHDERIHVDVFKTGIDIIEKVLEAVANV